MRQGKKDKGNVKFLYVVLGTVAVFLVVVTTVMVMNTVAGLDDVQDVSGMENQTAEEETDSKEIPEEKGIYAGKTEEPVKEEEPVNIYYVENTFDAAASDIEPTVSEEGWYIENIGCLKSVSYRGNVYDEKRIREMEKATFNAMREIDFSEFFDDKITKMTIDTRTLFSDKADGRPMRISLNMKNGCSFLVYDIDDFWQFRPIAFEVEPIINNNRDYIIDLAYLKVDNKNMQWSKWSDGMIDGFQKAFYQYVNEENLQLGTTIINPNSLFFDTEKKCYSFDLYSFDFDQDDLKWEVSYYQDEDRYEIELKKYTPQGGDEKSK